MRAESAGGARAESGGAQVKRGVGVVVAADFFVVLFFLGRARPCVCARVCARAGVGVGGFVCGRAHVSVSVCPARARDASPHARVGQCKGTASDCLSLSKGTASNAKEQRNCKQGAKEPQAIPATQFRIFHHAHARVGQ